MPYAAAAALVLLVKLFLPRAEGPYLLTAVTGDGEIRTILLPDSTRVKLNARSNLQRAMISNEQAKIAAREVDNALRQTVETSYNNAIAAAKSYNAARRQVDAREEAYRIAQQRFDIGATNYVEYQLAENDLFQARSDLSRGKYEFIFRKKVLDFYLGNPLGF